MQASRGPQNKGALLLRLPTKRANKVVHVDVVVAVPVVVVVAVVHPTEEKAVCKREGDVRDQEKQQEQDEHRETTKVYANPKKRKEYLGQQPRFERRRDKGRNVKTAMDAYFDNLA